MGNDFLDGIDEQFQLLMKLNGNGRRSGNSVGLPAEDRVIIEILEHLHKLSAAQREQVLAYVSSLQKAG